MLVTLVERRANVAAFFRLVSSGVMLQNGISDVFYSQNLMCLEKRVIILTAKTCPILNTVKRKGSRTAVFWSFPQKHYLKYLTSGKNASGENLAIFESLPKFVLANVRFENQFPRPVFGEK